MKNSCHDTAGGEREGQQKYEIRRIQEHLLDILSDVVRVCGKMGITYFIVGGTALGAVRHGGFIPWDDDLDIGMAREDYDRFLAGAQEHLRKDLFLQTYQTQEGSPFYFAKVRKDGTKFIEEYCRKLTIHPGIYIDIFPYDALPDEEKARERHYRKVKRMLNLYIAKCVTGTSVHYHGMKKLVYGCIRRTLHILMMPVSKRVLYRRTDGLMRRYNGSDSKYIGYGGLPKIQVARDWVKEPDTIEFEGLTVKCPGNIREYLAGNYGEHYMELPPEAERAGHAPWKVEY